MAESASDLAGSLTALPGMSLEELARVDDAVLEEVLAPFLKAPGKSEDRLWSQGGCGR